MRSAWHEDMNVEFDALLFNRNWTLVPHSLHMNIIGCKRTFRIKRKVDGSIDYYKARLIAKGYRQQILVTHTI